MNRYKEINRLASHHGMMWLLALLLCMAMPFCAFSQELNSEMVSSCNTANDQNYGGKPTTTTKIVIVTKQLEFIIPAVPEAIFDPESPDILEKLSNVPGFDKVMNDMAQHWGKFHGGKFQIEYAGRLIGEGKTISFEVSNLSDNLKRVYDVVIHTDNTSRRFIAHSLELKNWKQIYTKTIKTQLVKDIAKMEKLGDIQWIFRKTAKNPFTEQSLRESIIETLKKADVKKELEALFDKDKIFQKKISAILKEDIRNAGELIEELGNVDNFNIMFKIVD